MEIIIDNADILFRSIFSVTVLFLLTRLMGKKQISQLSLFDYVVGISIGSIAGSFSVFKDISYYDVLISLCVWSFFSIVVAFISLKSMMARKLIQGTSTIVVENGRILEKNLKKERFNVNDLLEELRMNGVFDISDVEFALLETSGRVSVQLKSQKQPVTPSDINVPTSYKGLSINLIIDGEIMKESLIFSDLNENWLREELEKRGIESLSEVMLAALDTNGNLYISLKNQKK